MRAYDYGTPLLSSPEISPEPRYERERSIHPTVDGF